MARTHPSTIDRGRHPDETALLKRGVVDPKVMLGKRVIHGTRITVELILEKLAADVPIEEILDDYPRLTRADVLVAIEYARRTVAAVEVIPDTRRAWMRFLADESVEAAVVATLRAAGYDVAYISEEFPGVRDHGDGEGATGT